MSVIAISNLNAKSPLQKIVSKLAWLIKGDFEALNCTSQGKFKTCYIQLSERLDPQYVVEMLKKKGQFKAYVPQHVPDLRPSKKGKIPIRIRRTLGIEFKPVQVCMWTHIAVITEMQYKFTGLYNLSRKTGHRLLNKISTIVVDRLKQIHASHPQMFDKCFRLTSQYRRDYPHDGDFQLILDTLHALQDEAKVPRAELTEADLTSVDLVPYSMDQVPFKVVEDTSKAYTHKIIKKVTEHVKNLDADLCDDDSPEEIARKRVRRELKNLAPYLPPIIRQVIGEYFTPQKTPFHHVTIYGEPFMPSKQVLAPFLKKFEAIRIVRSDRMFNLLKCIVRIQHVTPLQKRDGITLGGAKLVIRPSQIPLYKVPDYILDEIKAFFGETVVEFDYPGDERVDDEEGEENDDDCEELDEDVE